MLLSLISKQNNFHMLISLSESVASVGLGYHRVRFTNEENLYTILPVSQAVPSGTTRMEVDDKPSLTWHLGSVIYRSSPPSKPAVSRCRSDASCNWIQSGGHPDSLE